MLGPLIRVASLGSDVPRDGSQFEGDIQNDQPLDKASLPGLEWSGERRLYSLHAFIIPFLCHLSLQWSLFFLSASWVTSLFFFACPLFALQIVAPSLMKGWRSLPSLGAVLD